MSDEGIDVDLEDLGTVRDNLANFLTEFDELGDNTDKVEEAVGRPAGDGRLRSKVGDFESGWNGNRETIQDSLQNVHDHVKDFIEGLQEQDQALASDG
ncbi:hypothetical protein ACIQLJ_00570 [Microbacterium sp. NPDC091313]